jgi:type IV secretory pathway VirB2 component (pilin)
MDTSTGFGLAFVNEADVRGGLSLLRACRPIRKKGKRMRRILLLAAALSIPLAGASLALSGGVASAAKGPKGKTVCSSITGNVATTVTVSGCVDSNGANTGGGSQPLTVGSLAGGGTVTWLSGFTSTFSAATTTPTSAKHCPGYVKNAATEPSALKIAGAVSASNAGFKIPGTYKGEVCINQNTGAITAPKPLKVS